MSKRPTKEESVAALLKPLAPTNTELETQLNWNVKTKKTITIKKTLKGASLPLNVGVGEALLVS